MRYWLITYFLLITSILFSQEEKTKLFTIGIVGAPVYPAHPLLYHFYKVNRMAGLEFSIDINGFRKSGSKPRRESFVIGGGAYYETRFLKLTLDSRELNPSTGGHIWFRSTYDNDLKINNEYVSFSAFIERKYLINEEDQVSLRIAYYNLVLLTPQSYSVGITEEDFGPFGPSTYRHYTVNKIFSSNLNAFLFGIKYAHAITPAIRFEVQGNARVYSHPDINVKVSYWVSLGFSYSFGNVYRGK